MRRSAWPGGTDALVEVGAVAVPGCTREPLLQGLGTLKLCVPCEGAYWEISTCTTLPARAVAVMLKGFKSSPVVTVSVLSPACWISIVT